jgi:hypothetical protein
MYGTHECTISLEIRFWLLFNSLGEQVEQPLHRTLHLGSGAAGESGEHHLLDAKTFGGDFHHSEALQRGLTCPQTSCTQQENPV